MRDLVTYIQALADNVPHAEKINPVVSSSAVGWHVQHCIMVINGVTHQLKNSDPTQYKYKFNKIRSLIYLFNKIPRGKGKSPSVVNPAEVASIKDLQNMIELAKVNIEDLKPLPKQSNFMHPHFGMLDLPSTYKFLYIHTNHHLKIIKDILRSLK